MNTNLVPRIAVLFCALPLVVGFKADDAKTLQGTWVPVKWELGGSTTAPATMPSMKLTLKNGKYEFVEGPSHDVGAYSVKPSQKPKEMDLVGTKGPNAGKTIPAIYRFEGRRLTICYGLDGHRPQAFVSPKKSMVFLCVFSRKP